MTPEQLQELDNIKNVAASLGNSVANLLVDMSENILLSEEILRQSLTDIPPTPTYQLLSSALEINEGENVMITLNTTGLPAGTFVGFDVSGTLSPVDASGPFPTGFTINDAGSASFVVNVVNDATTEGQEFFTIILKDAPVSVTVQVKDTSLTPPPPVPTYSLNASSLSIAEGENVTITLNTTNVAEGSIVSYNITGVSSSDISVPLFGDFVVNAAGVASVNITAVNDLTTEGNEQLILSLVNGLASVNVQVRDTSVAPPPPPPDPTIGVVKEKVLNPTALILPRAYVRDSLTYERYQIHQEVNHGTVYAYEFRVTNESTPRPFRTTPYRLFIDDVEVMSITVSPSATVGVFNVNTSALSHGYHKLEIFGAIDEASIPSALFVKVAGAADPDKMLTMMGSHDCQHSGLLKYNYAWVPYKHEPTPRPLPVKTREHFSTALGRASLIAEELVPVRRSDIYRPRVTNGTLHTCNSQNYLITPLMLKVPDKALLDGPRGVGTVNGVTHLQVGRNGGVYFCEGWRIGHISTDGTIRTIVGLRSRNPADKHNTPDISDYDLIGNWSSVPVERRGFHEIWGMAFWKRSLAVDESAEAIPNNGTLEKPHISPGPVMFVPDSQGNRVLKLQFAHNSHETPVVVTEFITGLSDPWDCVEYNDVLYVSERLKNRVAKFSAFDGTYLGDFLTGPTGLSLANLASDRKPVAFVPLASLRAQTIVLPDGLAIMDDKLYISSQIMEQFKVYNLTTGSLIYTVNYSANYFNGYYNKLAVSDGTFGPKGTVFVEGWASNTSNGWPTAYLPDGTTWLYYFGEGPGKVFDTVDYGSSVGVGNGILVFGSSLEGITIVRKAIAGEKSYKWGEGYKAAIDEWQRLGYTQVHGRGGFGHYNLPLPWNVNTKIDYYLEMYGHVKP